MFSHIWRFLVDLFDWRTRERRRLGLPVVDVVFITNMRDEADRKRFLGGWQPPEGHFNGPRFWFGNVAGRTRAIDMTAEELKLNGPEDRERYKSDHKRAQGKFIAATRWAESNGAQVILLAASTKRLFGHDATKLKQMFPNLLFTIGDNGTAHLLCSETLRALRQAKLVPEHARVCVIGPTGHLGAQVVRRLVEYGYAVVGLCSDEKHISAARESGIEAAARFEDVGKVDAVVACAHNENVQLTRSSVEIIRKEKKRLLVVDVAAPHNMSKKEYRRCHGVVIRQDAGSAHSPKLKYVLGPFSYKLFRMSRGVVFGCFAETLTLMADIQAHDGRAIQEYDGFRVSPENMQMVGGLFSLHGFSALPPRCFGKAIHSFNLNL